MGCRVWGFWLRKLGAGTRAAGVQFRCIYELPDFKMSQGSLGLGFSGFGSSGGFWGVEEGFSGFESLGGFRGRMGLAFSGFGRFWGSGGFESRIGRV